mgnify:FL=1
MSFILSNSLYSENSVNKTHTTSVVGMTEKEVVKAKQYINGKDTVLEWGSGGSTLYFPPMVKKYVSIEHDSVWYNKLKFVVNDNVEYYNVPLADAKLDSMLDPHGYSVYLGCGDTHVHEGITYWATRMDGPHNDWHHFVDYIKKPLELSYRDYDVILVDGRSRAMCSYVASHLLKEDGYLIVHDFINRRYYHGILIYYEIVDQQDTLAVLKLRKKLLGEDEMNKISERILNEFQEKNITLVMGSAENEGDM